MSYNDNAPGPATPERHPQHWPLRRHHRTKRVYVDLIHALANMAWSVAYRLDQHVAAHDEGVTS